MMEQQQDMEQKDETTRFHTGAALREARERMGMSVEDVAGRLKFAPRQIVALEEGDFGQLPEMAFVRGFVRSYARLVQLDEAPLLEGLPSAPVPEASSEQKAREQFLPGASAARTQTIVWLAGALAVALVIAILAWQYREGPVAPKPSASATSGAEVTPAPDGKPGEGAKAGEAVTPGEEAKLAAMAPKTSAAMPVSSVPATLPAAPDSARQAATSASAVAAAREKVQKKRAGRLVRLEFDEDSWVEVKDANGKLLLSMLGKQGTSQSVSGPTPLSVTIGNAKGVRLYYKGEPVDVESDTGADIAHLTLE